MAVSIFFILSGFVMVYNYYKADKIRSCSFIKNIIFSYRKIKKLWILNLLLTSFLTLFWFSEEQNNPLWLLIYKLLLNILLIQEWFPIKDVSINGVSWFLCTILFANFVFPWWIRIIEKYYTKLIAYILTFFCLFLEIVIAVIANDLQSVLWIQQIPFIETNLSGWLVYSFPLSRFLDIVIGYNLAFIFLNIDSLPKKYTNAIQIFALILSFISCIFYNLYNEDLDNHLLSLLTLNFIFTTSSICLVFTFASNDGYLTNLIGNKIFLYFAQISPQIFLIHPIVFCCINKIYYHIPYIDPLPFIDKYGCYINLTIGFLITILCSEIWKNIEQTTFINRHG